ncbi:hypothetical protein [Nocardia huaxiensis]|uniref:hypothetical protein n=1 Tax=Nocardia huaxiensis TaxID=2755382 RepID=UPI001E5BBEE0|nr:hypothetical protein [Nocardia huaxiensis]UFS99581.1 hypothetical protein LPY97_17685 [Nocardia huaxiensis]
MDEYPALCTDLLEHVWTVPELHANSAVPEAVSLEELIDAEAVTLLESPLAVISAEGDTPMLTAKDVRLGRAPSRWGAARTDGSVLVRAGDIAVVTGTDPAARVCVDDGMLLGPTVQLVRTNPRAIDPQFLAGVLRAAVDAAAGTLVDLYQIQVPRLPLAEQRRYGTAFEQLVALETAWEQQRASVGRLVRLGFGGLAQGRLRPAVSAE